MRKLPRIIVKFKNYLSTSVFVLRLKRMVSYKINSSQLQTYRSPLWDLKRMFSYGKVLYCYCKRISVNHFYQFFFCRGKLWRVSGVYMDHNHCSLRCPSDVKTTSKLKKNLTTNSSILSAILQKNQVILLNPCLCFIKCATIFVLIVEESLYICDWCYI